MHYKHNSAVIQLTVLLYNRHSFSPTLSTTKVCYVKLKKNSQPLRNSQPYIAQSKWLTFVRSGNHIAAQLNQNQLTLILARVYPSVKNCMWPLQLVGFYQLAMQSLQLSLFGDQFLKLPHWHLAVYILQVINNPH